MASSLIKSALFQGITGPELQPLLSCLKADRRSYQKNATIYQIGDQVTSLGLILSGSVHIETDDAWGNKSILDSIKPGQVFAETYACIPGEPLMVNVTAAENTEILFINIEKLLKTCPTACAFHSRLIRNLLYVTAQKNLNLTHKIFHTAPKSIRGKLLSYLSFQAVKQARHSFEIPFNRQQLADYLRVDRSAMSNELSKMRQEGLIDYEKNRFCLKEKFHESK